MAKNPFKELREKLKLSGSKMALILGVNANYYYGLENGYYTLSKRRLEILKEKFNIDIEEFKRKLEEWKLEREKELLRGVKNGS